MGTDDPGTAPDGALDHHPGSPSGPTFRRLVREDLATHRGNLLDPGLHALVVHRLGRLAYSAHTPGRRALRPLFKAAQVLVVNLYGIELPLSARIGRRLRLAHAHGIVFVPRSSIGDDCLVRHNVTLGLGSVARKGSPRIGDRVQFGPGSIVMGDVTVGDDVLIGPNALVIDDVPAGSRVLAAPATVRPPRSGPTAGEEVPPHPVDDVLPQASERQEGARHL